MVKELGKKKKYFIILFMITIACCIIFYILKKVIAQRASYLLQLAKAAEERHGESAILEEQSAILEEKDDTIKEDDMKVDLTQHFVYQDYCPDALWEEYEAYKLRNTKPKDMIEEQSFETPQLEILLYYQTFVQLFRMHINKLSHLEHFRTNDTKSIKLKIFLRKSGKNDFSEVTNVYDFQEDTVEFDDKFSFQINYKELPEYMVYVSLWSINVFHHEILLGAAHIDLSSYSDYTSKNVIIGDVVPAKKDKNMYGHLLVGLCHLPEMERLLCVVMCGRDLKDDVTNMSILNNVINSFVDVFLINDGKIIKRHSMNVVLDNKNPIFNEAIEFYVPAHQIQTIDICLIAMHEYNRITNTLVGKVMVGNHTNGQYNVHWIDVLSNPEKLIPRWHPLTR